MPFVYIVTAPAGQVIRIDSFSEDGCDAIALYDISDDGLMDVISAQSSGDQAVYWYEQVTPYEWSRHTIDDIDAHFDGEIEGCAALELDGKLLVIASGQDGGNLSIYTPTTPGSPSGTWTRAELLAGHDWLQTVWAYDLDNDGELEIIFAHEGSSAATGGIYWLDYDGSDPMTPGDWTQYTIVQHPGAFWLAREFIDISGSGRGDLVFSARNLTGRNPDCDPGVYWLARPATVTNAWSITEVEGRDADWHKCEVGDFSGDGNGMDILAGDVTFGGLDIANYRFSTGYTRTDIPNPVPNEGMWNLRKIPAENGLGINGRDAFLAPFGSSFLYLFQWDGSAWEATALDYYPTQGHPLDNIIMWHDVDGDGRQEAFISDSSVVDSKLVWIDVE